MIGLHTYNVLFLRKKDDYISNKVDLGLLFQNPTKMRCNNTVFMFA